MFFCWKEHAPYSAVIITCATPKVSKHLIEQRNEGGKILSPLGADSSYRSLALMTKKEGRIEQKKLQELCLSR